MFWFIGGTDPDIYAKAKAANRLNEIPTNHNPRFLPVIHPTLKTGSRRWWSPRRRGHLRSGPVVAHSGPLHAAKDKRSGSTGDNIVHVLLLLLDLGGTFVFAISGAVAAVRHRLDIFGVLVLSFAAGNAGGITRDLLIGAVPPAAIADWKYLSISVLAGLLTFYWYRLIDRLSNPVLWFDAVGLAFSSPLPAHKRRWSTDLIQ